jgi:hypothetical protein
MNRRAALIARRLMCERLTRSLRCCVSCSHTISSSLLHFLLGSSSRTTLLTCGRVISGIFPPPVLLHLQQECSGQQSHYHVVVPARPATHLVLHQSGLALLHLELGFDVPPHRSHLTHLQEWSGACNVGQAELEVCAIQAATQQQPAFSPRQAVSTLPNPEPIELVAPLSLCSLGHSQGLPLRIRYLLGHLGHRLWWGTAFHQVLKVRFTTLTRPRGHGSLRTAGTGKHPFSSAHFKHIVPASFIQAVAQTGVATVYRVACHPLALHVVGLPSTLQQTKRYSTFGLKLHTLRHASGHPSLWIISPFSGQVQLPINQGMTKRRGIAQINPNLAITHPAQRAGVLASYSHRVVALLGGTALIKDKHSLRAVQARTEEVLQCFDYRVMLPGSLSEEALQGTGSGPGHRFGNILGITSVGTLDQQAA